MTKRMLIDATHAEETRVVVLDGNRLEDFDVETASKKQLKGNIYLAKIVRVEPSLQAAFVEYGGGRHGFLAFGEIHPDYYQIPVADRQRLLELQAEEARAAEEAEDAAAAEDAAPEPQPRERDRDRGGRDGRRGGRDRDRSRNAPAAEVPDMAGQPDLPSDPPEFSDMSAEPPIPAAEPASAVEPEAAVELAAIEAWAVQSALPHDEPGESVPTVPEPEPGAGRAAADVAAPERVEVEAAAAEASVPHDAAPAAEAAPGAAAPEPPPVEPPASHDGEPPHRPAQGALIPSETKYGETEYPAVSDADALEEKLPGEDPVEASLAESGLDARETEPGETIGDESEFDTESDLPAPETIGGESDTFEGNGAEEARQRRASRFLRNYRIQEVIRRRQIILVQVVKEERGTKGAALTTYISLAGRFCVLMPNSPRGGGISRKITSGADRRRLKEITAELEIPKGMGLIVRTAGANRPKPEIKRDCEYLMRLWDDIREHTMRSVAPALIYEEASLIKRAIRDVYSRDVDEIQVDGEAGWRSAHDFMRMLMPSHARKVQLWPRGGEPLFVKHGVEEQLDAMLAPTVQLKSGGYLVINQAEALVAIDVNSGRSTRERGIEETALKTNLEAADEVARQLRLRDLAGLIVIDFIDMESKKHNGMVEKRLKDALKTDRARIQVGYISHFGLLEMSRQRLRPSLAETSFVMCAHCGGLGHVRSIESSAIHVLRGIEEEGAKNRASLIMVYVANAIAMYILNHKRQRLSEIEARYGMEVHFTADETLLPPQIRIDRLRAPIPETERIAAQQALTGPVLPAAPLALPYDDQEAEADDVFGDEEDDEAPVLAVTAAPGSAEEKAANEENERRRRRRRRRRGGRRDGAPGEAAAEGGLVGSGAPVGEMDVSATPFPEDVEPAAVPAEAATMEDGAEPATAGEQPAVDPTDLDENGLPRARRRGRRGGRRRRRDAPGEEGTSVEDAPEPVPAYVAPPVYVGPTPADPFGGNTFDIFDMMDEAEEAPKPRRRPVGAAPLPATPGGAQASLDIPPVPADATPPVDVAPVVEPEPHAVEPVVAEPVAEHSVVELAGQGSTEAPVVEALPEPVVEPLAPHQVAELIPVEPAPEPMPQAPITPVPESADAASVASVEPMAAAEPPKPEPEKPSGPVIKPIVIGQDELPGIERKKGWWRK